MVKVISLLVVLFAIWAQVLPMAGSGVLDANGNLLFDRGATFYDAGVHLSLIAEMRDRFPPTNFALGGTPLKNYHYLYDAILALVVKLTNVSVFDLYFRLAPIAISLLLCLAIYLTIWRLTKSAWASGLGIFFTIFGTSLGSVTPFINFLLPGTTVSSSNNLYMTDQIYDWMVNPHGVLALAIFLFLFLCLSYYSETKKIRYLVVFSVLLGTSFGIKAYGGVVFAAGGILTAVWYLKDRTLPPVIAVLAGLGIMAAWFLKTTDQSVVGLRFAPLWFLERMMADPERLYQADFPILIQVYQSVGNWWHPLFLYLQALVIYVVGSLGLRILGLIPIILAIRHPRNLVKFSPPIVFLAGVGLTSFTVPLFFNQSSKPFDIVQFIPYFTLLMGIAFTITVFRSIKTLGRYRQTIVVTTLILIFIFLDRNELQQRWTMLSANRLSDKIVISQGLLAATSQLQRVSDPDSIILLPPTENNLGYLWFTSVANRRTVLSGKFFSQQVGADTARIEKEIRKAFMGEPASIHFDYLFLQSGERQYFDKLSKQYPLREVFSNQAAVIYQRT